MHEEKLADLNLKSLDNPVSLLLAVLRYMHPERLKAPEAQDKSTNYPSEFVFKTELFPCLRRGLIAYQEDKREREKWSPGFNQEDNLKKMMPPLVAEKVGFILIFEEKQPDRAEGWLAVGPNWYYPTKRVI